MSKQIAVIRGLLLLTGVGGLLSGFARGENLVATLSFVAGLGMYGILTAIEQAHVRTMQGLAAMTRDITSAPRR